MIEQEIDELKKTLIELAKAYYEDNQSLVSDAQYDQQYQRLVQLEKQYPHLLTPDSPTQRVQGSVSKGFTTVQHRTPMLSIYTETDTTVKGIQSFMQRVERGLLNHGVGSDKLTYCLEPKIDGLAISLVYHKGVLVSAVTRGNGEEGESVTTNALKIDSIPKTLPPWAPSDVEVRGEVYMAVSDFKSHNEQLVLLGQPALMNTRNAAAGGLRQIHEPLLKRPLSFLAYQLIIYGQTKGYTPPHSQRLALKELTSWGFPVTAYVEVARTEQEIEKYKREILEKRAWLNYDIDGVVYKVNSFEHQGLLGVASKEPRWLMAHKFPPEEGTAVITSIETQVGRTGKLTPVAHITPVLVGGVVVTKATLHNVFDLRKRGVRLGDPVYVRRAGDVVPEIKGPVLSTRAAYVENFQFPKNCPSCGNPVHREKGSMDYFCVSGNLCPAQVKNSILSATGRDALNIKGVGIALVEKLVLGGHVNNVVDLLHFLSEPTPEKKELVGGLKTWKNLVNSMHACMHKDLWRMIYALGIPHVGRTASKIIAKHHPTLEHLLGLTKEGCLALEGINTRTANAWSVFMEVKDNRLFMTRLHAAVMPLSESGAHLTEPSEGPLKGKVFVLTGTFANNTRQQLAARIVSCGGTIGSSVSKNTDYLVSGANPSSKLSKALKLGVNVILEETLVDLLV